MTKTIRYDKKIRTIGIAGLLFFVAMGITSVSCALLDPPQNPNVHPAHAVAIFGGVWALLSIAALWLIISYWRCRVAMSEKRLTQCGVLHKTTVWLDEIELVEWLAPGQRIRLHTGTAKMSVSLASFQMEDRVWLIRRFKELRGPIHEGWDSFCLRIAVPQLEQESCDVHSLNPHLVALKRSRWAWYFAPSAGVLAILGVFLGWTLQRPELLACPGPVLALWALLHFSTPKRGIVAPRISSEPGHGRYLVFLLVWGIVGLSAVLLFSLTQQNVIVGIVGLVVWFTGLMVQAVRFDRQRVQLEQKKAPKALLKWETLTRSKQPTG